MDLIRLTSTVKQIKLNSLPGAVDPEKLFLLLRRKKIPCFFLQTSSGIAETLTSAARETILGLGPFAKVDLDSNLIESLQSQVKLLTVPADSHRYSLGGVFGVLDYESAGLIEPCLQGRGHFQSLSKPEIFKAHRLFVFDHDQHELNLIDANNQPDFEILENCVLESLLENLPQEPDSSPQDETSQAPLTERLKASLGSLGFTEAFHRIKNHIRAGDIFQAVLSERFETETQATPEHIFLSLRRLSPAPYSFFFEFGDRIFLGASPESLIQVRDQVISTHPIAGTRPRQNPQSDQRQRKNLLRSRKEASEHLMLVDLARNDLGRSSRPGSVQVTQYRRVKILSHVMHLVSEVRGQLSPEFSAVQALALAFPAGTLSGAPKVRALQILSELEPQPRGLFGGALVAFDGHGGLDSCITIRSLEMKGKKAILRAGAGIVKHSKSNLEYQEIRHKTRLIEQAIAHAERSL